MIPCEEHHHPFEVKGTASLDEWGRRRFIPFHMGLTYLIFRLRTEEEQAPCTESDKKTKKTVNLAAKDGMTSHNQPNRFCISDFYWYEEVHISHTHCSSKFVLTVLARLTLWEGEESLLPYFRGSVVLRTLEHCKTDQLQYIVSQLQSARLC